MTTAKVKNWGEFQHYRDRSPPWIKLHRKLLDDFDFSRLPLASKALAPLIWMLAAESNDGTVRVDFDYLAFRLHITEAEAEAGVIPLIDRGFLEIASGVLAPCKQVAIPEREREGEAEGEREAKRTLGRQAARFSEFWDAYPMKKGRKEAEAKWKARNLDAIADRILADVSARKSSDRQWLDGFVPHGSTYVNSAGWEDAIETTRPTAGPVRNAVGASERKTETPQSRLEDARLLAARQVDLGVWTEAQAREYVAKAKAAA
jgi:hypothetical protein